MNISSFSLREFLSIFSVGMLPIAVSYIVIPKFQSYINGIDVKYAILLIPIIIPFGYTINAASHFIEGIFPFNKITDKIYKSFIRRKYDYMLISHHKNISRHIRRLIEEICESKSSDNILAALYTYRMLSREILPETHNSLYRVEGLYIFLRSSSLSLFIVLILYCFYGLKFEWWEFFLLTFSSLTSYIMSFLVQVYLYWHSAMYVILHSEFSEELHKKKIEEIIHKFCCES